MCIPLLPAHSVTVTGYCPKPTRPVTGSHVPQQQLEDVCFQTGPHPRGAGLTPHGDRCLTGLIRLEIRRPVCQVINDCLSRKLFWEKFISGSSSCDCSFKTLFYCLIYRARPNMTARWSGNNLKPLKVKKSRVCSSSVQCVEMFYYHYCDWITMIPDFFLATFPFQRRRIRNEKWPVQSNVVATAWMIHLSA